MFKDVLTQRTSSFWWTRNPRTVIYFLRELTGTFIALYCITFLAAALQDPTLAFVATTWFAVVSWIGLAASVFHTITWLAVTVTISPIPLPKFAQRIAFIGLIAAWLAASYFLLTYLYAK